ncbi:MAG: hypothetical protein GX675_05280 [Erysipelotrichaceae bacterium]|nr:hypothetical protein [Erysipelotrichaceae bacterium]
MKKGLKNILILLSLIFILVGCSNEKKAFSYFKETDGTQEDVEGFYEVGMYNTHYYFNVENLTEDKYIILNLKITDINDKSIYDKKTNLIKPKENYVVYLESEPYLYYTTDLSYYNLKTDINYEYYYDWAEDELFVDITKDGGFTDSEVEEVAKTEYAISILSNIIKTNYYFYDIPYDKELEGSQFDRKNALYKAIANYSDKTIKIYKVNGKELKEYKKIKMSFGY